MSERTRRAPVAPLDVFCTPLPLAAVALLALNDHVLKGAGWLPFWLTGKLSDFAGLFFFPLFLAAALGLLGLRRVRPPALVAGCAAATALVFAAIKSVPAASLAYEAAVGLLHGAGRVHNACDPTDLLALPMCLLAILYFRLAWRRLEGSRPQGAT